MDGHFLTNQFADFLPSSNLTSGPCANCGSPDAKRLCSGCRIVEKPKTVFGVYYCSQTCRDAHWKDHKTACKEVRALRRASFIFVELFHLFLLENWSSAVAHSTIGQDGLMTLHSDDKETDRRVFLGLPLVRPFPAHFAAGGHALAVLCNERCGEVLGLARPLFDQVMRHVCICAEAVTIWPYNIPKPYHTSMPAAKHDPFRTSTHVLVRITLGCGLQFAFDPAGAQYGWREALSPWPAFQGHRVRLLRGLSTLMMQDEREFHNYAVRAKASSPACSHLTEPLMGFLRKKLMTSFTTKVTSGGGLVPILCHLPDAKFDEVIKPTMERWKRYLKDEREEINRGPMEKPYWNADMERCLTQDERMYNRLKKVWFSEAEWYGLGEKGRETLWRSRFKQAMRNMPM